MFYEKLFKSVSYRIDEPLGEFSKELPGVFHGSVAISNFIMCNRLDWFCVLDQNKALFIDTGHPSLMGTTFFKEALGISNIPWENVTVFLTHFHIDHAGNLAYCFDSTIKQACFVMPEAFHPNSARNFYMWTRSSSKVRNDQDAREHLDLLNGKHYLDGIPLNKCSIANRGDYFNYSDLHLEVLPTPGHAPEHACLLDSENHLLFAGDHFLFAKPGMMQLAPDQHLLSRYIDSLSLIRSFRIKALFMSHHAPLMGDDLIDSFILDTQNGYKSLLERAKSLVSSSGVVSAFELAEIIANHYPNGINSFEPALQIRRVALMFGTLEGLHDEGMVERRQDDDGAFVYFVKRAK